MLEVIELGKRLFRDLMSPDDNVSDRLILVQDRNFLGYYKSRETILKFDGWSEKKIQHFLATGELVVFFHFNTRQYFKYKDIKKAQLTDYYRNTPPFDPGPRSGADKNNKPMSEDFLSRLIETTDEKQVNSLYLCAIKAFGKSRADMAMQKRQEKPICFGMSAYTLDIPIVQDQLANKPTEDREMTVTKLCKEQLKPHPLQVNSRNKAHVRNIQKNWDPLAVGAIIVATRNGGYLTIDGQHRVDAAPPDTVFDCIVLTDRTDAEIADLWRKYNVVRKAKTAIARHHHDVKGEEDMAVFINKLITSVGREANNRGKCSTNIACVDVIRRMINKLDKQNGNGRAVMESIFPVLKELSAGKAISSSLVAGLAELESRISPQTSLTEKRWRERLMTIGYERIVNTIKTKSPVNGGAGERHWAEAILSALNTNLPKDRKLVARGIND